MKFGINTLAVVLGMELGLPLATYWLNCFTFNKIFVVFIPNFPAIHAITDKSSKITCKFTKEVTNIKSSEIWAAILKVDESQ